MCYVKHIPIVEVDSHIYQTNIPNKASDLSLVTMSGSWGPTDPSLWLTRALGHWEAQLMVNWPPGVPGPSRCTINNVTFLRH